MSHASPFGLDQWLQAHAESLDTGAAHAAGLLPAAGDARLFCIGVPRSEGGAGGTTGDALEAIAATAPPKPLPITTTRRNTGVAGKATGDPDPGLAAGLLGDGRNPSTRVQAETPHAAKDLDRR